MTVLFISDLHLDDSRPEVTACFIKFLAGEARQAERLYILGDLFEVWIGNDPDDTNQQSVVQALRDFSDAGGSCRFTHGNRDFLIDAGFAASTGIEIQPPQHVIELYGEKALLLHGDELCTDDKSYQRLRRVFRSSSLQAIFRGLPGVVQRAVARRVRSASESAINQKPPVILDVNPQAVEATMRKYQVRLMIHGHTHRPAIHKLTLDGHVARRIVLGAWYEQASILRWNEQGPELVSLPYP